LVSVTLMPLERLKDTTLPHVLGEVVGDLAELFQKELQLAKAEISANVLTKLNAGIWMGAAGILSILAVLFLLEAIVFAIASSGIGLSWSSLIVAVGTAAIAAAAFFKGRADAQEDMTPARSIQNIKQDIATAKEQMT
jgi:hypothetical protein